MYDVAGSADLPVLCKIFYMVAHILLTLCVDIKTLHEIHTSINKFKYTSNNPIKSMATSYIVTAPVKLTYPGGYKVSF